MKERPIIKLPVSKSDRAIENLCRLLLVAMWASAIYFYIILPAIIPIHFNISGEADNYGNKYAILLLPIVATAIFLGINFLQNRPHILNYLKEITAENALRQYTIASRMLQLLKLSILLVFTIIILSMYLTGTGTIKTLSIWVLPLIPALIMIPVIISIAKSVKSK